MLRLSLMLCLALWLPVALAANEVPASVMVESPELAAIAARLARDEPVRSRFRQTKAMRLLSRPLVSEGEMIFDRALGLYWHIETPFASTLLMNNEQVVQLNGSQKSVVTAAQQPVAFGFAKVFFQVLSGDLNGLQQEFSVSLAPMADAWQITLVPKEAQLRAVLSQIVIDGVDDINQVTMTDQAGDTTTIDFFDQRPGAGALTDQERALYAF
ncbi:outer membrane lipoprotein carrier protein LolA [Halioxenophilus sp. WMMB6]|uniref:outer membrane lipoprotein carrier protein LolA n=1 Tax=Halioxenophilus sp. WMMB6 TaxID=3073815 RepID=UPI00295F16C7|nr:outer membrane lipoprotein carrier protein LolA [Halioxenophilus sp. WMMB6]